MENIYFLNMIRVCQVLHGIVGGGSEQVVLNYCSRMHNIHFDLLYQYEPNSQILERFRDAGINCIQIPDKVHHPLKHLWTMFNIFRNGRYDVVHGHLDWYMNSYVCFLAMLAGIKKRIAHHHQVYTIDESFRALPRNLLCSVMRVPCKLFATHWLACGDAAAIDGWGKCAVKKGKVTILPNAIDPERFKFSESSRKEIRERYGIKEGDFVIGHIGRFYPQKNHKFLIDVFSVILKQKLNAKLLLLGDGPLQDEIRQKVKSLGVTEAVVFAGLQKDPAPFYSAMDVFVFPSLWEGLGIVLLEAQYNGLPCIVSGSVPDEACISNEFYSLNVLQSSQKWGEAIINCMGKRNSHIENAFFDIRKTFALLQRLYFA